MVFNYEKKEVYYKNPCLFHYQMSFTSKENGGNRSFSYETKASISLIPMSRMRLRCPIMKKKRLLCDEWKKHFSYETKANKL